MRVDGLLARVAPETACALVTVIRVEGSAPRAPGASMLVMTDGVVGSIGGGRLEHAAVARARTMLDGHDTAPIVERHALGPSLGQCCGGAVTLWIAPLGRAGAPHAWRTALVEAERRGQPSILVTVIASEREEVRVGTRMVLTADGSHVTDLSPTLAPTIELAARKFLASTGERADCLRVGPAGSSLVVFVEPDPDGSAVFVFGAGHVGRALVPILATLPGRVTWIDSRANAFPDVAPEGVECRVAAFPEDEVETAPSGASFVVLTHDHALDLRLAEAILRRVDVAYFGLIGSATKRARFVRRLRMRNIAAERLAAMRCPIGLAGIGGKSPGEVAVAIAAELLVHRAASQRATGAADGGGFSGTGPAPLGVRATPRRSRRRSRGSRAARVGPCRA